MSTRPIGMFDSGVGGLSVAREICRALPSEDVVYVADTAYCPYGDRPNEEVKARALAMARHLRDIGAKLVIAACNTATGAALEDMRAAQSVPVVGLEPAVKTGVARTRNRRVGVMATAGTLASERFARLVREHAQGAQVVAQPCPGLADLIEEGQLTGPRLLALLQELTAPLRRARVDTVVLGCTHYSFVRPALAEVFGPGVDLVDSAPAIARRAHWLLEEAGLRARDGQGTLRLLTTGEPEEVAPVVERVWGSLLPVEKIVV